MNNEKGRISIRLFIDSIVIWSKACSNGILFILMIGLAVVLGANIVMRFIFNHPISWSNTVSRYAYVYIVLLGTAVSYIEGQHAQIDFVYDALPRKFKIIFDLLHILAMMIISIVLLFIGIKHSVSMWHVHAPTIPWLSVGIVYLSVPISAVIIIIFLIQKLLSVKKD